MTDKNSANAITPQTNPLGCLTRSIWFLWGNLGLAFLAAYIVAEKKYQLSSLDLIYWLIALAILGGRYADIKWLNGTTAQSQPATMATWRRFTLYLLLMAAGGWLLAHGLAKAMEYLK